ncbi:MAG: alpha/beta hydrolase [Nitrospirae bacterium]|nr:alpha/beta hydrolase [Nitrospirota bacterium]
MKETTYKDFRIHYNDEGKGDVLLLLHGFCESSEIWDYFRDNLSRRFRVITPDLLGHGKSSPPAVRNSSGEFINTMEMQAESAAAVLKSAGVERCTVVGHSMGGYTALAFAELFPEKVKGLCLFHSTAMADPEEKRRDRDKAIEAVKKDKKAFLEGLIPKMYAPANVIKMKGQVGKTLSAAMVIPEDGLIAALAGMRDRKDRQHVLEGAAYPVLFIIGRDDLLIPPDKMLPLIMKPGHAEVLILSGVGHMGFYEERDKTLFAIEKFVEETIQDDRMDGPE